MKFHLFAPLILAMPVWCGEEISATDNLYYDSLTILATSNLADTASSWGRRELNPVLASHGAFGAKSALLKLGIVGSLVGAEQLAIRGHSGRKRWLAWVNVASGVVFYGVAMRNLHVPIRHGDAPQRMR